MLADVIFVVCVLLFRDIIFTSLLGGMFAHVSTHVRGVEHFHAVKNITTNEILHIIHQLYVRTCGQRQHCRRRVLQTWQLDSSLLAARTEEPSMCHWVPPYVLLRPHVSKAVRALHASTQLVHGHRISPHVPMRSCIPLHTPL